MKKRLVMLLAACCVLAAFSMPAFALEYRFDGPDAGLFGRPTSDDTIYVSAENSVNIDRSKDTACLPPAVWAPALYAPAYTAVMEDLYYPGGWLATLNIPSLGLSVKVYQGIDGDALRRGAGHFADTSIWDGNVAIAGHNRGVNNHFGGIHTLRPGDSIELTTKLGTRGYEVYSVTKISEDDISALNASADNILTLITCVADQPNFRWCVRAREK